MLLSAGSGNISSRISSHDLGTVLLPCLLQGLEQLDRLAVALIQRQRTPDRLFGLGEFTRLHKHERQLEMSRGQSGVTGHGLFQPGARLGGPFPLQQHGPDIQVGQGHGGIAGDRPLVGRTGAGGVPALLKGHADIHLGEGLAGIGLS